MTSSNNDDDIPCLSESTMKVLQEFIMEQSLKEKALQNQIISSGNDVLGTSDIEENWQLSQFWYNEETTEILSNEICRLAGKHGKIALISCPTLYKPVRKLCADNEVYLLEFDKRFSIYGSDFVWYDYNKPKALPSHLTSSCDVVILDPPFLSEECLGKVAVTAKLLAKDKIILCTGSVMEEFANVLLDVRKCRFQPRHMNNLANEFMCFANYNLDDFIRAHNRNSEIL